MARAFRGRRPAGDPAWRGLSDEELRRALSARATAAGAAVGQITLAPRPVVSLPRSPGRLSRYTPHVARTVATRMRKEQLGLRMVLAREAARGRYTWVLWMREDAHWCAPLRHLLLSSPPDATNVDAIRFAPLQLSRFDAAAVHAKGCGGFGGWNDKVWLMARRWAPPMLSMYDDLLAPADAPCEYTACVAAPAADFLAAPSVEQFRERAGRLHRVPFVKHPPEELPTIDSYFAHVAGVNGTKRRLCFPQVYARNCVPRVNQSAVDAMRCS